MAVKMCSSCGYVIADPSRPCPSCGAERPLSAHDPLQPQPRGKSPQNMSTILLCAIILLEAFVFYNPEVVGMAFKKLKNVFAGVPEQKAPALEQTAPAPEQTALRIAMSDADFIKLCRSGFSQEISDAIQNGANVNAKAHDDMTTPLMEVIKYDSNPKFLEAMAILIDAGADVNARDKNDMTPLMIAMGYPAILHPEITKTLIEAGADVNARRDEYGDTPLILAVTGNETDAAMALIEAGADVSVRDREGNTPLMLAAALKRFNDKLITALINAGADANEGDAGNRLLMRAAREASDPAVITALIEAGADISVRDSEGNTLLMLAAAWERFNDKLITALIKAGADAKEGDAGNRLLMRACSLASDPAVIAALVEAGADVNARYNDCANSTPLILAAEYNANTEVIKTLIEAGADINARNQYGWTPLSIAVTMSDSSETAMFLIEAGADVNARYNGDRTVLMLAAGNANPEVIAALIKAGANVNARDICGNTTLLFAGENEEVTALLVKAGADTNTIDKEGSTTYAKIIVTGDNVNIRSVPSLKGKICGRADSGRMFVAGSTPVRDARDNSEWYKILFTIDEASGEIFRAHNPYVYSHPYISARFVKRAELNWDERDQLDFYLRWPALIKLQAATDRESLALREQPSTKGKIITELSDEGLYYGWLYAKPTPIKSDGVSWYKVQFIRRFSQALQAKYYEHNDRNSAYFYVNTKEVYQTPLDARDQDFLNLFDQGRPLMFGIGDDLARVKKLTCEGDRFRSAETKIPLTLYWEPDEGAQTFTLPAGSLIIDWTPFSIYMAHDPFPMYDPFPQLGRYFDMRDNSWVAVIDARSRKVIGWHDESYDTEVFPGTPDLDDWGNMSDEAFIY